MMDAAQFIGEMLAELANKYRKVTFKYGYSLDNECHVVEITPQSAFENDALTAAWVPKSLEFLNLFPDDDIVFISDDSILALGTYKLEFNANTEAEVLLQFFKPLLVSEFEASFFTTMAVVENTASGSRFINQANSYMATNESATQDLPCDDINDEFLMAA
ncbi:hypothetical protein [Sediminibacterium soli]|uniref:hypothetical protein n=1 Tax=Sediminibacterium soli TaxID=2698829 RepID=UPI00137AE10A|nr:hypothetical protein [Sediminibacterium soli]NCI48230.1 hypothetical protein [Sediminibacterium soli]